jgi:DNA-binding response OmpR family regulator
MTAQRRSGLTVLVVDDDASVREIVREFLAISGYAVLEASDADGGLRIAHEHDGPLHLLITDVALRGMSGVDLEAQVTRVRPGIRVLFISGSAEGRAVQAAALPPGKDYLQKPFSLAGLLARVRDLLE